MKKKVDEKNAITFNNSVLFCFLNDCRYFILRRSGLKYLQLISCCHVYLVPLLLSVTVLNSSSCYIQYDLVICCVSLQYKKYDNKNLAHFVIIQVRFMK